MSDEPQRTLFVWASLVTLLIFLRYSVPVKDDWDQHVCLKISTPLRQISTKNPVVLVLNHETVFAYGFIDKKEDHQLSS